MQQDCLGPDHASIIRNRFRGKEATHNGGVLNAEDVPL